MGARFGDPAVLHHGHPVIARCRMMTSHAFSTLAPGNAAPRPLGVDDRPGSGPSSMARDSGYGGSAGQAIHAPPSSDPAAIRRR
ncbi:hypothetical protein GCM10010433_11890 [Streptomyces pulveraceus]